MTTNHSFSRSLLAQAQPYIAAQMNKPFLQGLIHGTLPVDRFEYWLKVDYPYLLNFIKVMAVGMAKADTLQDMSVFLEHIRSIEKEMRDHEAHAARIGLAKEALLSYQPGPLKYSYMRHQLSTAHQGTVGETQAAVLACQWGYGECCRTLLQQYGINADNPYQKFFAFHASEEHLPGLQISLDLLDRHAATSTEPQRQKMTTAFMISVRHETMLWDEYYNKVVWESY